jgi:seryl-tRNA synthetase
VGSANLENLSVNTEEFRNQLLETGVLVDAGSPGLYHRSADYEGVVRALEFYARVSGRDDNPQRLFFAPVINLETLKGSGYVDSFPNLIGTIDSFNGDPKQLSELHKRVDSGGDWLELMSPTDVALPSAACHSVYPMYKDATLPVEGLYFEVLANCFRHEPSMDPARMQSFRMHEFVYLGSPDDALNFRDRWVAKGRELLRDLGLVNDLVPANDPFFGRGAQMMAQGQLEKELKFEITAPISSDAPGAISSGNYHEDHFGVTYSISTHDGQVAHSACFGLGLDRITLALYYAHGFRLEEWPSEVRERLVLDQSSYLNGPS